MDSNLCRCIARSRAAGIAYALPALLSACASLLPDSNKVAGTPWKSYEEAEGVYEKIVPFKTTLAQLKTLGIDPRETPNVSVLSHVDLLRRLQAMVQFEGSALDPAIKRCVASREACYAYRVEQHLEDRERVGNFWADFLDFRRVTHVTGWQFDTLILISNGVVIYKSWSGKRHLQEVEQEHHPLGPLQGIGSSIR
jgi:hypothetical protein